MRFLQSFLTFYGLPVRDNSPFLGCYGDNFATTPNLDKLASEGFLYTHAYANAPVCAPARNTIISGVYASSNGNQHMRSFYEASPTIKFYPEFLREKGYYCTNNKKDGLQTLQLPILKKSGMSAIPMPITKTASRVSRSLPSSIQ